MGCAVINEREPRTGAQEPLLWDLLLYYRYGAYNCFVGLGRTVQTLTGCLCDDELGARLRPCANVFTLTTLQSCRPISEAAPRLEYSSRRITALIVMFPVEGIIAYGGAASVLSPAFDGQRCAGPVSDPTALQRLLTGTRYVAAWHLEISEREYAIVVSHMQPRRLLLQ